MIDLSINFYSYFKLQSISNVKKYQWQITIPIKISSLLLSIMILNNMSKSSTESINYWVRADRRVEDTFKGCKIIESNFEQILSCQKII